MPKANDPWSGPPGKVYKAHKKLFSPDVIRHVESCYPQTQIDQLVAVLTERIVYKKPPRDNADRQARINELVHRYGHNFHRIRDDAERILADAKIRPTDLTLKTIMIAEHNSRETTAEEAIRENRDVLNPFYRVIVGHAILDPDINPDYLQTVHPCKRLDVCEDYPQLQR